MAEPVPQFSVVIPLYNKRRYILRAVESVLGQTVHDLELIVVDDGSTDGSAQALSHLSDPRLRIIRQDNSGMGPARNAGMSLAVGRWIAFLDGDDMWFSDHLEELARTATAFPQAGLVSTSTLQVPDGTNVSQPTAQHPVLAQIDWFVEAARNKSVINASSSAIQRHVYQAVGGFENFKAGPDQEYWARVALRYPIALSRKITVVYFRNTNGNNERLAAERRGKPQPPRSSLEDLSPTVRMLCRARARGDEAAQSNSVVHYINGMVDAAIRHSLYCGDILAAKSFGRMYLAPTRPQAQVLRGVLKLPSPAIAAMLKGYRLAMRLRRDMRGRESRSGVQS